jgi:hypothetical protein
MEMLKAQSPKRITLDLSREAAVEMPANTVIKIETIRSLDEWKAHRDNFKNLKPAMLQGDKLFVWPSMKMK